MVKPHFIAEIMLLTTEEGGRIGPAASKYRPHLQFDHNPYVKTSGQQIYLDKDWVYPGESAIAEITLLFDNLKYDVGDSFKFYEGKRQVGFGKIIEIL